jgi:leader peptidase (prepilin peptidase)/N-methyltransferase
LGAKCRSCGKKISLRYPAIEGATALGFLYIYSVYCSGASGEVVFLWANSLGRAFLPFLFFVFAVMVTIFVIDLERQIIPDSLVFCGLIVTICALIFSGGINIYPNLLSGFGAALFLLLLFLVTKQKGMGLGDVKLALFAGVFLGYPGTVTWLFASFLIGALVGIGLILAKKASFGKHIPFGPFLVVSFFIAVFFGERIVKWLNF